MKKIIEFEETVKVHHKVTIDISSDNDSLIDVALDEIENKHTSNIDDAVEILKAHIPVLDVEEETYAEKVSIEYFDDYDVE